MTIDVTESYHPLTELVTLVNALPKNCKLHILFTHFENFILNVSLQLSTKGKFSQEFPFDWENGKQQAEKLFRNFKMEQQTERTVEKRIVRYSPMDEIV